MEALEAVVLSSFFAVNKNLNLIKTAFRTKYKVVATPIKMENNILPVPGSIYRKKLFIQFTPIIVIKNIVFYNLPFVI